MIKLLMAVAIFSAVALPAFSAELNARDGAPGRRVGGGTRLVSIGMN